LTRDSRYTNQLLDPKGFSAFGALGVAVVGSLGDGVLTGEWVILG
jgi:hypothetical protein